jgi:hypothetical protein
MGVSSSLTLFSAEAWPQRIPGQHIGQLLIDFFKKRRDFLFSMGFIKVGV